VLLELTLDNISYIKESLVQIFPDWDVTDDLEIIQSQSPKHVRIITEQQMGQAKSLGLYPSAFSIDPKTIWIKFAIVNNGEHCGGGGIQ